MVFVHTKVQVYYHEKNISQNYHNTVHIKLYCAPLIPQRTSCDQEIQTWLHVYTCDPIYSYIIRASWSKPHINHSYEKIVGWPPLPRSCEGLGSATLDYLCGSSILRRLENEEVGDHYTASVVSFCSDKAVTFMICISDSISDML